MCGREVNIVYRSIKVILSNHRLIHNVERLFGMYDIDNFQNALTQVGLCETRKLAWSILFAISLNILFTEHGSSSDLSLELKKKPKLPFTKNIRFN